MVIGEVVEIEPARVQICFHRFAMQFATSAKQIFSGILAQNLLLNYFQHPFCCCSLTVDLVSC